MNPFRVLEPLLHTPLSLEMCQRIHALTLYRAAQGYLPSTTPGHIQLASLQQQIARKGTDVCFLHPAEVMYVFEGVTLAVYQSIEMLYCSRVGRSIGMVWHILSSMAKLSGASPVTYEAVWSICVSLEKQRYAHGAVSLERGQESWWIGIVKSDSSTQQTDTDGKEGPFLLCVVDIQHSQVLSFRLASQETASHTLSLALYEALLFLRRPHQRVPAGVLWHLPKQIITDISCLSDSRAACTRMHIAVSASTGDYPFTHTLQTLWTSAGSGNALSPSQRMRVLDRILGKALGSGPLQVQGQHDHHYAHLSGYAQEPDWIFPMLRAFLPAHAATTTEEGVIEYDGLHYTDDLLTYFPAHPITIRRPPQTEAHLWVYLEQDILCRAMARELQRRDGTYRRSRPGR